MIVTYKAKFFINHDNKAETDTLKKCSPHSTTDFSLRAAPLESSSATVTRELFLRTCLQRFGPKPFGQIVSLANRQRDNRQRRILPAA